MRYFGTILLTLLLAAAALAHTHSSASYTVPAEVFGAAGVVGVSPSYGEIGVISGLNLGVTTSPSYSIREGFLPAAFPSLAVLVTAVTPDSGFNTGRIRITKIEGGGFAAGATVKLATTGEADIAATDVVVGSTEIACVFDIIAKKTGRWDLTVTNPDGTSGTLPLAFNIKTWSDTKVALNTPNPFSPPAEATTIIYKLEKDTDVTVAIFSVTADLLWKRNYPAGLNGGRAGDNTVLWTGLSDFSEYASNGVYLVHVIDRSNGRTLARGKIAVIRR